ncbi:putative glycolipid-binding domain-containing protein [uncultured Paracoccus sp.]|uniref:putative glycolipid-binding domain-containing protein n=1 Tax=uncultured Paracoccus sp. TaxID=189685 RepID=UPI002610665B|nr:putative glycolipid-binding domain-containing protein [uncultured Paracoccus sp.]
MGEGGAQIVWRRLDHPGHDACRLWSEGSLWRIEGMAVWLDPEGPAQIAYEVSAGEDWITRSARIMGRVGKRAFSLSIHRDAMGNWRVNGEALPEVTGLADIDLGFTPATNTLPIRRLRGARQESADLAAAWLDPGDWQVKPLPQHYEVRDDGRWSYRSPGHGFETEMTIDGDGLITDYPPLWVKEG